MVRLNRKTASDLRSLILIKSLLILCFWFSTQQTYATIIKSNVKEVFTEEGIPHTLVIIYNHLGEQASVHTDVSGEFSIDLPEGIYGLEFKSFGYHPCFLKRLEVRGELIRLQPIRLVVMSNANFSNLLASSEKDAQIYYPSGELRGEGTYKKKVFNKFRNTRLSKHGIWRYYHKDGMFSEEITYKNDKKHGKYRSYYANGLAKQEGDYKQSKKNGTWYFYNKNGKFVYMTVFHEGIQTITSQELSEEIRKEPAVRR